MKKSMIKKIVIIILILILLIIAYNLKYYKIKNRVPDIKKNNYKINNIKPLGWIRVQGTNIDYPVVYYYDLDDPSDPTYDFAWNFQKEKKMVNHTSLLSHNILNSSSHPLIAKKGQRRFEQLLSFIYYDFVKKNKYIQYTVDGKNYLYKIYGISFQKEKKVILNDIPKNKLESYISYTRDASYFKFDVDVNKNDKLLTLITCTRFFGATTDYSFVVDARKVRNNELITNYKVSKTSNYKSIEKTLKGAD